MNTRLSILALLFACCACTHAAVGAPPGWVRRGSHMAEGQRVVGVASAGRTNTSALARSTASNRARREILRQVAAARPTSGASLVTAYGIEIESLWQDAEGRVWAMAVLEHR